MGVGEGGCGGSGGHARSGGVRGGQLADAPTHPLSRTPPPTHPPPLCLGTSRVAPYLLTGLTDSRHYTPLAEEGRVYRFSPLRVSRSAGDIDRVHVSGGVGEVWVGGWVGSWVGVGVRDDCWRVHLCLRAPGGAPKCMNRWPAPVPPQGVDERIEVEDFLRGIGFYARLIELASIADESATEAGVGTAAAAQAAEDAAEL